jgi:hypothetical protein
MDYDIRRIEALERVVMNAASQIIHATPQSDLVKECANKLRPFIQKNRRMDVTFQAQDGILTILVKVPNAQ